MRSPAPLRLSLLSDRREHPAQGVLGGGPGGAAEIVMSDGTRPHPKSRTTIAPGTRLVMRYAGGGGYGDPRRATRRRWRPICATATSPTPAPYRGR